ncbi:MAG: ABC transporter substrate-binding protein [Rickettsiales bacterium]|nr:ABC transporter substrate-binding protein [Rickettsiales bacterium]
MNPNSPQGGEIAIGVVGSFNSLNPFILSGQSASGIGYSFDSLMAKSKDELSSYYPLIAKSISIKPLESKIEFELNNFVRFHNNEKLTAKDIKFTFETLKSEGHPRYKIAFRDIKEITINNDYNISFEIKDISNKDLISQIVLTPILSADFFDKNKFDKVSLKPILGSGPYQIEKANPGNSITYTKSINYWGKDLPVNIGLYNFDEIKFIYYRDSNIAIRGIKAKEYDIRFENIAKNWATQYQNTELIQEFIPHSIPTPMQSFVINNRLNKFSDINTRKALNLAFNFEWTNKNLFYNSYDRTNSFFENSVFSASDEISSEEKKLYEQIELPKSEFSKFNQIEIPINSESGYNRESLIKAKNLLLSGHYQYKEQKLVDKKTNKQFEIEFLITSPSFKRVILPYIANLNKLGIKSKIKQVDSSIYQKRLENFDFDITVSVFPTSMIPGNELYAYLHSDNKDIVGSMNLAGINNQYVDKLIEKIINIENFDDLKNYTNALDRILLSNYYVIPHWNISGFRLVYWDKIQHPDISPDYDICLECWYKSDI